MEHECEYSSHHYWKLEGRRMLCPQRSVSADQLRAAFKCPLSMRNDARRDCMDYVN